MGLRFDRLFAILVAMVVAGQLHSQVRDAERLLTEGDHLAWLKNWQAAEPYFEKAETAFRASGDSRNALYAEVSRLRGALPKLSLIETSQALAEKLDDPLMKADLTLRLRCLVVKGDVDLDLDTELAKSDWTEALEIATKLNEEAWMNRATGELGIISFLHGDSRSGTFMVAGVLAKAEKLNDVGAQVRYLTLIGDGLVEWQRYDPSLKMFDQAISLSKKTAGLGEPAMAYAGKATALVSMGRTSEARELLQNLLQIAHKKGATGYESEALEQLAWLARLLASLREEHPRDLWVVEKVGAHPCIVTSDLEREFRGTRSIEFLAFLAILCCGIAAYVALRMRRLEAAISHFGTGRLEIRVPSDTRDPTHRLSVAFNRMAERIESLVNAHRRLCIDISHELRSPLDKVTARDRTGAVRYARCAQSNRTEIISPERSR